MADVKESHGVRLEYGNRKGTLFLNYDILPTEETIIFHKYVRVLENRGSGAVPVAQRRLRNMGIGAQS